MDSITDAGDLRALYGEPRDLVQRKALKALDRHCRRFVSLSPFLVLATADADGRVDASPRGDAPGFVTVLDERTLLIPDRPGNKRIDSLRNVVSNPQAGLLFMIPGVKETLRVNGRAEITTDSDLLEPLAVRGKAPQSGLILHVDEAFLHCAKAFIRSKLWDPEARIERQTLPSLGRMIADQIKGVDPDKADEYVEESYRNRLY